jgi:hypothetical protein
MIFEAIAAIQLANEAIGAIKEMCGNVQSVGQMGSQLVKLADAKEQIQKDAAEGSMEAFMQLEEIKNQEAEIKRTFIYHGRPGLWDDYCKFMQNRAMLKKKAEEREKAKRLAKRKAIKTGITILAVSLSVFTAIGLGIFMVYWLVSLRGK